MTSSFSPYSVDYSWSKEAKQLREMAVKSPWLISKEFILRHFQSLRIVDKQVGIEVSDVMSWLYLGVSFHLFQKSENVF